MVERLIPTISAISAIPNVWRSRENDSKMAMPYSSDRDSLGSGFGLIRAEADGGLFERF